MELFSSTFLGRVGILSLVECEGEDDESVVPAAPEGAEGPEAVAVSSELLDVIVVMDVYGSCDVLTGSSVVFGNDSV